MSGLLNFNSSFDASSKMKSVKIVLKNLDWTNVGLVFLFYVFLYSFLAGWYSLMLLGVMATASSGHTMLWTFFVSGVSFAVLVSLTVYVSQYQERKKLEDIPEPLSKRTSQLADLSIKNDVLQCV